jgi:hypothetical protein
MKMIAFWDTAPGSLFEVDQRFRGVYCLHHQGDGGRTITTTTTIIIIIIIIMSVVPLET